MARRPRTAPRRKPPGIARQIGERIEALRTELGLTQEKLAWEAGLSAKSTLSRIEAGQRLPSVETLDVLARRLGVEARDLLIFPERGVIDLAMDLVRRGGTKVALEVVRAAERAESPTVSASSRRRRV